MSISSKISFRKFTLFLVSLIGFIGALITIYAFYIQQKSIELRYEILSNTNILDIKADVNQFDILYDGRSLKAANENVRIITFRIINNGNTDILKDYYDEDVPLGFQIKKGLLLKEPEIVEASNNYLRDNLKIHTDSCHNILFSRIILEPSEYFVVKVIVKYTLNNTPTIQPVGKIAGIKSIQVINSIEQKESVSFLGAVFSGSILIQLVRSFAYSVALIIITGLFGISFIGISEQKNKSRRKTLIESFKFDPKYSYNKMDDAIFQRFIQDDIYILRNMRRFVRSEKYLNFHYSRVLMREKNNPKLGFPPSFGQFFSII